MCQAFVFRKQNEQRYHVVFKSLRPPHNVQHFDCMTKLIWHYYSILFRSLEKPWQFATTLFVVSSYNISWRKNVTIINHADKLRTSIQICRHILDTLYIQSYLLTSRTLVLSTFSKGNSHRTRCTLARTTCFSLCRLNCVQARNIPSQGITYYDELRVEAYWCHVSSQCGVFSGCHCVKISRILCEIVYIWK